jgi:hypothetical protein
MPQVIGDAPGAEYYVTCFGLVKDTQSKKEEWLYVEDFSNDHMYDEKGEHKGLIPSIGAVDLKALEYRRYTLKGLELSFPVIQPVYLFDGEKAMFFSRRPARNRLKGISVTNTELIDPILNLAPVLHKSIPMLVAKPAKRRDARALQRAEIDFGAAVAPRRKPDAPAAYNPYKGTRIEAYLKCFNNKIRRVPLQYGIKMIKKGVVSVPVGREWCLAPSFTGAFDYVFFRRLLPIALMKETGSVVILNKLFKQEFKDQFPQL